MLTFFLIRLACENAYSVVITYRFQRRKRKSMDPDRSYSMSRIAKHRLSQVDDLRRFLGHARVFRDLNLSGDIEKVIRVQSKKVDSRYRHRSAKQGHRNK